MTWDAVRTALAQAYATITITSPAAVSIRTVYAHPPASVQEYPCFVIVPPDEIEVNRLSGVREEVVTVRVRFMCLDGGDTAVATSVAAAFREATIAKLSTQTTLKGTGSTPTGMLLSEREGPIQPATYAGQPVVIFESTLTIHHETVEEMS